MMYNNINITLLVIQVLSLILQIVGVLTPGWDLEYSEYLGSKTSMGIWYVSYCQDEDEEPCKVKFIPAMKGDENEWLKHSLIKVQVCTTIAMASCIGGIILLMLITTKKVARTMDSGVTKCFVFCLICMVDLISGVLTMQAAGAQGSDMKKKYDEFKDLKSITIPFPYSAFLVFLGGTAAVAVSCIIVVMRPWRFPQYNVASTNNPCANCGLGATENAIANYSNWNRAMNDHTNVHNNPVVERGIDRTEFRIIESGEQSWSSHGINEMGTSDTEPLAANVAHSNAAN